MSKKNPMSDCQLAANSCLNYQARRAMRVLTHVYDKALEPAGMRGTQFTLLNSITLMQSPTINQLAEALVIDRTTLTRNLKLLENNELINIQSGQDKREKQVKLTTPGNKALKQALPLWKAVHEQVYEQIGKKRFNRLLDDLKILENLSNI